MPRYTPEQAREMTRWRAMRRERPRDVVVPGAGQESVWDYPRPPRVEPVMAEVRVALAGVQLACSERAYRVCETAGAPVYYVPPADVRMACLATTERETLCEWKGMARYWSADVGGRVVVDVAWSYPDPETPYAVIRDYLAFFPGRVDAAFVGGERVRPQPGGFYGGWVTSAIVGPFKGAPGTEHW